MVKIILNYDPTSGSLTDANNMIAGTLMGAVGVEPDALPTKTVLKLKEAGFETEDIIAMHKAGVIA